VEGNGNSGGVGGVIGPGISGGGGGMLHLQKLQTKHNTVLRLMFLQQHLGLTMKALSLS